MLFFFACVGRPPKQTAPQCPTRDDEKALCAKTSHGAILDLMQTEFLAHLRNTYSEF